MHRAMEAGIDDVGIGALFGLADHRFEVLAMMRHAEELERLYGCGPHTVSVPRIEPAPGSEMTENVPFPVDDDSFRTIIAVIRLSLPYTGIILSTRESAELRQELFKYGVSQVSAGSKHPSAGILKKRLKTSSLPWATTGAWKKSSSTWWGMGFIPSFCTGCYRKGRVGQDFMDLAKPGLIKHYCLPNGIVSFAEYLMDFAGEETRTKGFALIKKLTEEESDPVIKGNITSSLEKITAGERDIYL